MDASWSYEAWKPTTTRWFDYGRKSTKPSKWVFEEDQAHLRYYAERLSALPYDPGYAAQRANALHQLGYPEIAATGAYKAIMLCDAGINHSGNPELGEKVRVYFGMRLWYEKQDKALAEEELEVNARNIESRLNVQNLLSELNSNTATLNVQHLLFRVLKDVRRKAYLTLIDSLLCLQSVADAIEIGKDALKNYPGDGSISERLEHAINWKDDIEIQLFLQIRLSGALISELPAQMVCALNGTCESRMYPWTPRRLYTRKAATIASANEALASCSPSLEIRKSNVGTKPGAPQSFGMFATREIRAHELVLDNKTPLGVSNLQTEGYCYNCARSLASLNPKVFSCCPKMKYCSQECLKLAHIHYHKALCGKNFEYVYAGTEIVNLNVRLYLRLLAILVQFGGNPLEHPFVSWMLLQPGTLLFFTLEVSVVGPISMLQELGVDVFDMKYDDWILQTVWNRVSNNRAIKADMPLMSTFVSPIYNFFNHSCKPNTIQVMRTEGESHSSTAVVFTTKSIKKGEELFTTYIDHQKLGMSKEARWKLLEHWFGDEGCKCEKCSRE